MSATQNGIMLPPGSLIHLPEYMRGEFERRKTYGMTYNKNILNSRPRRSWVRCASNVIIKENDTERVGFILGSVGGFADDYGITQRNLSVMGYDFKGNPHTIKNNDVNVLKPYVPSPGVESVEIEIRNIYRGATINWKCYSIDQFDYMFRYFCTPYNTITIEWGWDDYDDLNSNILINYNDMGRISSFDKDGIVIERGNGYYGLYTNPELIEEKLERSKGRYDAFIGHVVKFNYTYNSSDNSFSVKTEIASSSKFYYGLALNRGFLSSRSTIVNLKTYIQTKLWDELKNPVNSRNNRKKINLLNGEYDIKSKDPKTLNNLKNINKYRISKLESEIDFLKTLSLSKNPVKIDDRYFDPKEYAKSRSIDLQRFNDSLYISFGLFVDILNAYNVQFGDNILGPKINIENCIIGGHPNMISNDPSFLIPNEVAPLIDPRSLTDNPKLYFKVEEKDEEPISETNSRFKDIDVMTSEILFGPESNKKPIRQDLNNIINYGNSKNREFPSRDDTSRYNSGMLRNIYLSKGLILSAIEEPTLKSVLKVICDKLNYSMPYWDLHVELNHDNTTISIVDRRYSNKFQLTNSSEQFYSFDPYSQNTIFKSFNFNVELSTQVASMVVNESNSQNDIDNNPNKIVSDGSNVGLLIGDGNVFDLFAGNKDIEKLMDPEIEEREKTKKSASELIELVKSNIKNINERSFTFEINNEDGNSKKVARLMIPNDQTHKLLQLLNDPTGKTYTNISNMPIPGVTVEFEVLGISGFKLHQIFRVNDLPKPYKDRVLFRVIETKEIISNGEWTTSVKSSIIPVDKIETFLQD